MRMVWRSCSDDVGVAVDQEEPHLRLLSRATPKNCPPGFLTDQSIRYENQDQATCQDRIRLLGGQSKRDVLTVSCGPSSVTTGSVRAVFGTDLA